MEGRLLKKTNREVLTKGRTSLSSLVGTGSKRQVDGLDEEIIVDS